MEGRAAPHCVVVEFPSYEAALACYRSPQYRKAIDARAGKAEFDMVLIEGVARKTDGSGHGQGLLDRARRGEQR